MDIRAETEHNTDIRAERPEVYEPPTLDEIGRFTALTRANVEGWYVERYGYFYA